MNINISVKEIPRHTGRLPENIVIIRQYLSLSLSLPPPLSHSLPLNNSLTSSQRNDMTLNELPRSSVCVVDSIGNAGVGDSFQRLVLGFN